MNQLWVKEQIPIAFQKARELPTIWIPTDSVFYNTESTML